VSRVLGGRPQAIGWAGARVYNFNVTEKETFYLSESLRDNHSAGLGPNWGNLFNYARLWENRVGADYRQIPVYPKVDNKVWDQYWAPYDHDGTGAYAQDRQHVNSAIGPVVAVMQMTMFLGAEEVPKPDYVDAREGPNQKYYRANVHIKPVIGLWNPYNVPIDPQVYLLEWAYNPYMRIDFQKPNPNGTFPNGSGFVTEIWMRDYWEIRKGIISTNADSVGSYMRVQTQAVDFQPGELRLFSPSQVTALGQRNELTPRLEPNGSYKTTILCSQTTTGRTKKGQPLVVPGGFYGWFGDVVLQDTHWDGGTVTGGSVGTQQHFGNQLKKTASPAVMTFKRQDSSGAIQHLARYCNLWNGGEDESAHEPYLPERIVTDRSNLRRDGSGGKTPHAVEDLAAGVLGPVGSWRFSLRDPAKIVDPDQRARGWIDSNPAAPVGNVLFDGSHTTDSARNGWGTMSHWVAEAHQTGARRGEVGDGGGGNRGLVAEGFKNWDNAYPPSPAVVNDTRWRGYIKEDYFGGDGVTHAAIYDVPRAPLVSLGQFQHAQTSRYQYEPSYVIGNSYANPRLPLARLSEMDYNGIAGFEMVDTSYELNERLWDAYFFSTLAPDYLSESVSSYDSEFSFEALAQGSESLPNPRMRFRPQVGDQHFATILSAAGQRAPEALAARLRVEGAFNVNSTSVGAWKAFLSGLGASEMPWIDPETGAVSWARPEGVRFNRFHQPLSETAYEGTDYASEFWQGWRKLDDTQLDELAQAIVKEVKARGPFLSLADFVNRDPEAPEAEQQRAGALQSALDAAVNNQLSGEVGQAASAPPGPNFDPAAVGPENEAAGAAAYLLQGDVLQSLAPLMQVRSDYFRVRAYGDARDGSGKIVARAWCEALVQREAAFTDPADDAAADYAGLTPLNQTFGRRYQVVGFRWLSPEEI
ncbi:MAG: hypothetical protein ACQKBY_02280, partial [Verrucomicrobiales bacterium]